MNWEQLGTNSIKKGAAKFVCSGSLGDPDIALLATDVDEACRSYGSISKV
jgi:hypothetical protein